MNNTSKKVLAVDSGSERIGIAISDQTGTIANPLLVLKHTKREKDAEQIVTIAMEHEVTEIIIGQAFYSDGTPNPSGRKSARLAEAIRNITQIPVILWDEYGSTKIARKAMKEIGKGKKKQRSHLDDIAATVILQDYLDSFSDNSFLFQEHLE